MKVKRPGDASERRSPRIARPIPSYIDRLPGYTHLSCGHLTTPEVSILYAVFKPGEIRGVFCEDCKDWREPVKRAQRKEYPKEPMF